MSQAIKVEYGYDFPSMCVIVDVRINLSWAEQEQWKAWDISPTPGDIQPAAKVHHLNNHSFMRIADEALKYHYIDCTGVADYYLRVANQVILSLKALLTAPTSQFIPKDMLNLILSSTRSLLGSTMPEYLESKELGYNGWKNKNYQHKSMIVPVEYMTEEAVAYHQSNQTSKQLELLAKRLPGVDETVKYPCKCDSHITAVAPLFTVIIHLNDHADWSREEIADWIETLDVDTTFKSEPITLVGRKE